MRYPTPAATITATATAENVIPSTAVNKACRSNGCAIQHTTRVAAAGIGRAAFTVVPLGVVEPSCSPATPHCSRPTTCLLDDNLKIFDVVVSGQPVRLMHLHRQHAHLPRHMLSHLMTLKPRTTMRTPSEPCHDQPTTIALCTITHGYNMTQEVQQSMARGSVPCGHLRG